MAPVSTYNVRATRSGRYWALEIEGLGVTQSRSLGRDADNMIRDYVSLLTDVDEDSVEYTLTTEVGNGLDAEAAAARKAAREADEAVRKAAARNRAAAKHLCAAGLTGRDTAAVLGITPQRVSQLLRDRAAV